MTGIQRKTFASRPWHIYFLLLCGLDICGFGPGPGVRYSGGRHFLLGEQPERSEHRARTWAMLMNDRQSNTVHVEMLIRLSSRDARRAINISRDVVTMTFRWPPSNLKEPTWDSAWWSECLRIFLWLVSLVKKSNDYSNSKLIQCFLTLWLIQVLN